MPRAVVIGGGIAGLAAVHNLKRALVSGLDVTVLDAARVAGGKLKTGSVAGVDVELGADSFVDRDGTLARFCADIGIRELESPRVFGAALWLHDNLVSLPTSTFMGIPLDPGAAQEAGVLSLRGRARAETERLWPKAHSGPDVSVGRLLRTRFGDEVVERMVDPVLAGTRAGLVDEIGVAAALPEVDDAARSHRSISAALRATNERRAISASSFARPRAGMSHLVDKLTDGLGPENLRLSTKAVRLARSGRAYVVALQDGGVLRADAVIVAVPAHEAAAILRDIDDRLARDLTKIRYASPSVLTLAYDEDSAPRLPHGRSGILAPRLRGASFDACTFYSVKWDRPGAAILRVFAGRTTGDEIVDEERWAQRVESELQRALSFGGRAAVKQVTRWPQGLPIYGVGHRDLVGAIFERVSAHPGLELAGAAYLGSGIAPCIEQAATAARRAAHYIGTLSGAGAREP